MPSNAMVETDLGPWKAFNVKSNASKVHKLVVPWFIEMYGNYYGLSFVKSLKLDVIKQVEMATTTKLGLIKCCQAAAEEFPISLTDVDKQVKAAAGMNFDIGSSIHADSMPSSAERSLRVHLEERLCRRFENYYESILKIEGTGDRPLPASFKCKFVAEPDVTTLHWTWLKLKFLAPPPRIQRLGERPWNRSRLRSKTRLPRQRLRQLSPRAPCQRPGGNLLMLEALNKCVF
jgi:hypothetical protein